jgi:hypothetical protein
MVKEARSSIRQNMIRIGVPIALAGALLTAEDYRLYDIAEQQRDCALLTGMPYLTLPEEV